MKDFQLCRELSRKLSKDLGATPFSINKVSLTHPDLLVKSTLKISEDDLVKDVPMWYGEAFGVEGKTCCLLAALEPDPDNLEIACIIGFKDSKDQIIEDAIRVGFKYDWTDDDDYGILVMRSKNRWIELSLNQRLQLALGFENMVQEGVPWHKQANVPEEFMKNLSDVIALDEEAAK